MSDRYLGGHMGNAFTTSRFGTNSGMFTLGQQLDALGNGAWPSDYDIALQFTDSGSFEVPEGVDEIAEYIILAGGAGGGADAGGGGGAGGLRIGAGLPVIAGKVYPIAVGGGGSGGDHPVAPSQGGNGLPSAFETEANVRYYVSVGDPGAGNKYYYKLTSDESDAISNVASRSLDLYEGSTYVFDQSHPTNDGHPIRFSTTGAPSSATPYTTGVSTNQPSVAAGAAGSGVMIVVAGSAPQLYTYCTIHGTGMGGAANTLANVTVKSDGGGGGAAWEAPAGQPGGCGGGNGAAASASSYMGNSIAITQVTAAGETTTSQGFAGGSAGGIAPHGLTNYAGAGGGGVGGRGGNVQSIAPQARAGNGGNGTTLTMLGTSKIYGGGGGGGDGPLATSPGGGKGGNANFFGEFRGGAGDGSHVTVKHGAFAPNGSPGIAGTGGGGGGGGILKDGGTGGSGLVFIKFKNKPTNKIFTFNASTTWKNDFGAKKAEYLIVGGGGGGGYRTGGGGGAGGFRAGTGLDIESDTLKIAVGAGGAATPASPVTSSNGGGSFIQGGTYHIGSNGGGGGASSAPGAPGWNGQKGASGGGASRSFIANSGGTGGPAIALSPTTGHAPAYPTQGSLSQTTSTSVQGFDGAAGNLGAGTGSAGGGGGSAQAGFAGTTDIGGNGGNGLTSSITGTSLPYAGGGAGANNNSTAPGAEVDKSFGGDFGKSGGNSAAVNAPSAPQVATEKAESGRINSGGGGGGGFGQYPDTNAPFNVGASGSSGIVVLKITE